MPFHYDTSIKKRLDYESIRLPELSIFKWNDKILMIEIKQPLPSEISLLPMAEESFISLGDKMNELLDIIGQLESLFLDESCFQAGTFND